MRDNHESCSYDNVFLFYCILLTSRIIHKTHAYMHATYIYINKEKIKEIKYKS